MKMIGFCLYAFVYLRIGFCYPSYRALRLRQDIPYRAVCIMMAGGMMLADARHCGQITKAALPPLLLCLFTDRAMQEIPDLCHMIPLLICLFSRQACITEAVLAAGLLVPSACRGMLGWGDVKLIVSWTAVLGADSAGAVMAGCILALLQFRKRPDAIVIAFGPCLCIGIYALLLFQGK